VYVHDTARRDQHVSGAGREWKEQVDARRGWKEFQRPDFLRLKARYGVDWVVLQQPGARGLSCPYQIKAFSYARI
jgi:hypothetical protein